MYKVIWNRYGRFGGEKVFENRDSALKFFYTVRRWRSCTKAELTAA